jgi:hypothetical protein
VAKKPAGNKVAGPAYPAPRADRNVCIRKIANGYVLRESGTRKGEYFERETFTRTAPKLVIGGAKD